MSGATLSPPAGGGPARFDERSSASGERWSRIRVAALLAGAVGAVCAVSLAQRVLLLHEAWPALAQGVARDAIAALLWIPLAAAVLRLARRVPFRRANLIVTVPFHLAACGAAALVLNVAWATTVAAVGLWPAADVGFATLVARHTIGLFHANALVYALLLAWAGLRTHETDARVAMKGDDGASTAEPADDGPLRRVAVRRNERTMLIDVAAIDRFEAAGDYVRVHAGADSFLIHERMQSLEARLDACFVRVHRSAIVRLDRVLEVRTRPAGDATLLLHDGTTVPLSRRRRAQVMERLAP